MAMKVVPRRMPIAGRHQQEDRDDRCQADAQLPRSDRPVSLRRMLSVFLPIANVVDNVDSARGKTECEESEQGAFDRLRLVEFLRQEQRRQHEDVLCPLCGPEGSEQCAEHQGLSWSVRQQ